MKKTNAEPPPPREEELAPASTGPAWPPRGMREKVAAYYVGMSPATLRRAMESGEIARVTLMPGIKVYLRDDLDAWLDRKAGRSPASGGLTGWEE